MSKLRIVSLVPKKKSRIIKRRGREGGRKKGQFSGFSGAAQLFISRLFSHSTRVPETPIRSAGKRERGGEEKKKPHRVIVIAQRVYTALLLISCRCDDEIGWLFSTWFIDTNPWLRLPARARTLLQRRKILFIAYLINVNNPVNKL